jgi:DNA polymerase-3 subunit epsilon
MNLQKPISFLDCETTGISTTKDRIVELHIARKNLDGTIDEFTSRFNPYPTEISASAMEVHGITQEDLIDAPVFADKADEILAFIEGSDLSGYNIIAFDIPMLFEEFVRAGKMFNYRKFRIFDTYQMWTRHEPRTLAGATKRFLNQDLVNAHQAKSDVDASIGIFFKQLEEWVITDLDEISNAKEIEKQLDFSGKIIKTESGDIILTFGKHANKTIHEVYQQDPQYFKWIFEKSDMASDTKMIAKQIYNKLSTSN